LLRRKTCSREVANAVASVRTEGACAIHLLEEATGAWYAVPGACHADLVAPAVTRHPDGRWYAEWSPHISTPARDSSRSRSPPAMSSSESCSCRFDPAVPLADDEREVVELLAAEAALALHMRRLHENARRQQREAEELAWVARTLNETLDVTEVGRRVVDSVLLLFGATFSRLAHARARWRARRARMGGRTAGILGTHGRARCRLTSWRIRSWH
jgi:hypothetical protein